jgi:hypothetical protein
MAPDKKSSGLFASFKSKSKKGEMQHNNKHHLNLLPSRHHANVLKMQVIRGL